MTRSRESPSPPTADRRRRAETATAESDRHRLRRDTSCRGRRHVVATRSIHRDVTVAGTIRTSFRTDSPPSSATATDPPQDRYGDLLSRLRLGHRAVPRPVRVGNVDRDAGADPRCGGGRGHELHRSATHPRRPAPGRRRSPDLARQAALVPERDPRRARPHTRGRRHAERLQLRRPVVAHEDRLGERLRRPSSPNGSARVAILDTGIDGSHPDLDGNVVAARRSSTARTVSATRTATARPWPESSRPRPTTVQASPASAMPASR